MRRTQAHIIAGTSVGPRTWIAIRTEDLDQNRPTGRLISAEIETTSYYGGNSTSVVVFTIETNGVRQIMNTPLDHPIGIVSIRPEGEQA